MSVTLSFGKNGTPAEGNFDISQYGYTSVPFACPIINQTSGNQYFDVRFNGDKCTKNMLYYTGTSDRAAEIRVNTMVLLVGK